MWQIIKNIENLEILQTIPHNDNVKEVCLKSLQIYKKRRKEKSHVHKYSQPFLNTLLKRFWLKLQPRVFFGMMQQA